MPVLSADFSKISTDFEPLPEGEYTVRIEGITEATSSGGLPQLNVELVITSGDFAERKKTDFLTLKQTDGKTNNVSYGRLKAYAEAISGSPVEGSELDTDTLLNGECRVLIKHRSYQGKDGTSKMSDDIKKVLPL